MNATRFLAVFAALGLAASLAEARHCRSCGTCKEKAPKCYKMREVKDYCKAEKHCTCSYSCPEGSMVEGSEDEGY